MPTCYAGNTGLVTMAKVVETRNGGSPEFKNYALFSGGHDSLVATHQQMESGEAECVLHIDTGIGVKQTKEFVRDTVDEFDWPLVSLTSDHDYEDIVLKNQFPGPAVHIIMYSKLKERALRHIPRNTQASGKPHFMTGVRRHESDARFRNMENPTVEAQQWIWEAPIHDFHTSDVQDYMTDHDLPESPVKKLYHHSGECLCGAFGNRAEELVLLEAHFPETANRIKELEQRVQAKHGDDDPRSYWGHGGMSSIDLRALLADNDETQMMLCKSCEKTIDE